MGILLRLRQPKVGAVVRCQDIGQAAGERLCRKRYGEPAVLPLSYFEHQSTENSFLLAKSIFVAIPVSLLFFVPFLLSSKYPLSFWQAYGLGCVALPIGYLIHRTVTKLLF